MGENVEVKQDDFGVKFGPEEGSGDTSKLVDSDQDSDLDSDEGKFIKDSNKSVFRSAGTKKIPDDEMELLREKMRTARHARKDESSKKTYDEDDVQFSKLQLTAIAALLLALFYVLYEREHVHICALRFYAYVANDSDCQYMLGQRYYVGEGVQRNKTTALYWFKQSAAQGHPYASYNLAVAHIQGFWRLEKGKAHELLKHAATHGVREAEHILNKACAKGECDR